MIKNIPLKYIASYIGITLKIFHEQGDDSFEIMKDERIRLSFDQSGTDLVLIGMLQRPSRIERAVDPSILAEALSLDQHEISAGQLVPAAVKTEVAHLMVPLKSAETLNKIVPHKSLLIKIADKYKFEGVYCFIVSTNDKGHFAQARFFNPGMRIDEDPATGSAAGPLAGYLFQNGFVHQNIDYKILQGQKINHPSVIHFKVTDEGIWIRGHSMLVMEGTVYE